MDAGECGKTPLFIMTRERSEVVSDIIKYYFRQRYTPEIEESVQRWLIEGGESPEKEAALKALWEGLPFSDAESAGESFAAVSRKLGIKVPEKVEKQVLKRNVNRKWLRIAAVVVPLMILVTGGLVYFNSKGPVTESTVVADGEVKWTEITVPLGSEREVLLPDGSELLVKAVKTASVVSFPENFAGGERTVKMEGETYFDVVEDNSRPFTVNTPNLTVEVLGTEFNIEAYSVDDNEVISVVSGRVRVLTKEGDEFVLEKDRKLNYMVTNINRSDGSISGIMTVEK